MRVTVAAPAKVNLRLRVGAPDGSGFHPIDTLFCTLQLADTVVARAGAGRDPQLELGFAPPLDALPDMGPPDRNLAVRAARAFMERAGIEEAPELRLVKRIPAGGGLGGGSSDAAAVLRAMQRLHPRTLDSGDLLELAAGLGSDVPFFALGAPLAHGTGRGERLAPLRPLPVRPAVVAIPDFPVPTAEAFRWLDATRTDAPDVPEEPGHDTTGPDWDTAIDQAVNDFEASVFERHPVLREIKAMLQDHRARPALLSGSGSTVFGIFEADAEAKRAAAALTDAYPGVRILVTRTRAR